MTGPNVDYTIELVDQPAILEQCAAMMTSSSPWCDLRFTVGQCVESLMSPQLRVHVAFARENRLVLGFLADLPHGIGFEPLIEYLCVAHDHRNREIGRTLVRHFEDVLHPDADNYFLFVSDINPDAARLYQQLGYRMVGALPDYNLMRQTEFLYRKAVRPRRQRTPSTDDDLDAAR